MLMILTMLLSTAQTNCVTDNISTADTLETLSVIALDLYEKEAVMPDGAVVQIAETLGITDGLHMLKQMDLYPKRILLRLDKGQCNVKQCGLGNNNETRSPRKIEYFDKNGYLVKRHGVGRVAIPSDHVLCRRSRSCTMRAAFITTVTAMRAPLSGATSLLSVFGLLTVDTPCKLSFDPLMAGHH